jgi:NTP pyrophosphatase (non-canonical NTP hydrolase)
MNFREYQDMALSTRQTPNKPTEDKIIPLLGLAGEVGELVSEYKKRLRDGEAHGAHKERVEEELGDILWYLTDAAARFGLNLDTIAEKNLQKCKARWGQSNGEHRPHFDAAFPEKECFPREMDVQFVTLEDQGRSLVRMIYNGKQLGNDITDNATDEDGYRYHDAFHLTCAAKLRWSPVLRKLMERKRKSDPSVDEVQDGGRAQVIEEAISALAFAYAQEHKYLENVDFLDSNLLRIIKKLTRNLEVAVCTPKEWEDVFLTAYEIWRELKQRKGGVVHLNLYNRTIRLLPDENSAGHKEN